MLRLILFHFVFLFAFQSFSQQKSGVIKVRKKVDSKGLYILEDGEYFKIKCYLRLFENEAAVFLNAPINANKANDSTARLLYTYRIRPSTYKIVNDSIYIYGYENNFAFEYKGIVKNGKLTLRKTYRSKTENKLFKQVL